MKDLETEFKNLMQEVIDKIQAKKESGEYDSWDASELTEKVQGVLDNMDHSRYGEICPLGHDDPDCGWSPSMGYHC